jgi:hypothetical protein
VTEAIQRALAGVARRRRWSAEALYAVVSLCTGGTFALDAGADEWTPQRTSIGLFRFTEGTARRFGVEASPHPPPALKSASMEPVASQRWATWTVACMSVADQVDLLERYLVGAFERRAPRRPVDYYLAALGAAPGLDDSTRIGNGRTVGELRRELDGEIIKIKRSSSSGMGDVFWTLLVMVLVRRAVL